MNFKLDGLSASLEPAITKWGYEDLEDNPSAHRWRAWWSGSVVDGGVSGVEMKAYPIIKTTPCGAWIDALAWRERYGADMRWNSSFIGKRFIHNGSGQAWAKPTQEEAIFSLAIRLCRWSKRVASDVRRANSAANALMKLRPDLADFAGAAIKNMKGQA